MLRSYRHNTDENNILINRIYFEIHKTTYN